ncbi:Cytochrome c554 and c-prime [Tistlia consotensis]|uniref:Cytochrome c554 and c-prime n=1 Tax=Tistlia consotensis USBA 355 TaxID=560819 RepID=A0A1Y6CT96_9PROT|nr:multiheme c-type cytochrome [Tistlia consotensis]SMF72578.1 Cytochrome c554 and c-prime [Tistlia consotensis USBA 355]SNS09429.1 Cytochrome c554 and c-prime [Tistlia consotensis]
MFYIRGIFCSTLGSPLRLSGLLAAGSALVAVGSALAAVGTLVGGLSLVAAADTEAAPPRTAIPAEAAIPREGTPGSADPRGAAPAGGARLLLAQASGGGLLTDSGDDLLTDGGGDDLLSGDQPAGDDGLLPATGAGTGDDLLGGQGGGNEGQGGAQGGGLLSNDLTTGGEAKPDNLLQNDLLAPADTGAAPGETEPEKTPAQMHAELFAATGDLYPSANQCATCHPRQYEQWSVSQHAYAQLSPVYMAMQMAINAKLAGTDGDFCIRCHNQVGMNLGESVYVSNLDRHPTSREGITCVVCHRVAHDYGKVSGRLPLKQGDLFSPVYGPTGDSELKRVLASPEQYRVVTKRGESGRGIHQDVKRFFALTRPTFCGACHDVTLFNGFRLEEAFSEYRRTESAATGVTCQDCHMGKEQGVASGYDEGPAATVGGVPTRPRKLTNHYFAGPDYSIVHPGIFPHNVEAAAFKPLRDWLRFDVDSGWGTDAFENGAALDHPYPDAWLAIDDRYDARKILDEQQRRLAWAQQQRLEVLRNGFKLGEIRVVEADADGLGFQVEVRNGTAGHAVPTGFDAERLIFLEVEVRDADGKLVYVSGDRDPNGDVRDAHSLYVHDGELPLDEDLFSLQSRFLVRMQRGGEREEVLALNHSFSPQPFVRPEARATTIYGRPRGARKQKMTIEPLGSRTASYRVPAGSLSGAGPYRISVRLVSQMVPVNLVAAIQGVGFDYGMSSKQVADRVVAGASTLWTREATVEIEGRPERSAARPRAEQSASSLQGEGR